MIRQLGNPFRQIPVTVSTPAYTEFGVNIADAILAQNPPPASTGLPSLTTGATLIDQIQGVRDIGRPWTIKSFSVSGNIFLFNNNVPPVYGRLGKIIASLGVIPQTQFNSNLLWTQCPFVIPALPLPVDSSKSFVLFDPSNDDLPPSTAPGVPIGGSLDLPEPLEIQSGSSATVGIWMLPSIATSAAGGGSYYIANLSLQLMNMAYSIIYEESEKSGQGPT